MGIQLLHSDFCWLAFGRDPLFSCLTMWVFIMSPLQGALCDIQMNWSLSSLSASLEDRINISCRTNQGIRNYLIWYPQTPDGTVKLLIYYMQYLHSGVPSKLSDSGSEKDYFFIISHLEPEDITTYYCQKDSKHPSTIIRLKT